MLGEGQSCVAQLLVAAVTAAAVGPDRDRGGRQRVVVHGLGFPATAHLPHLLRLRRPVPRATARRRRCGSAKDRCPPGRPRSFGLLDAGRRHRLRPGPPDRLRRRHHRGRLLRPRRRGTPRRRLRLVRHRRPRRRPGLGRSRRPRVAARGWQYVDTAAATYTWQLLDAATGDEVDDGRHRHHRRLHRRARRRAGLHAGRPRLRRRGLLDRRAPVRQPGRGDDVRPRGDRRRPPTIDAEDHEQVGARRRRSPSPASPTTARRRRRRADGAAGQDRRAGTFQAVGDAGRPTTDGLVRAVVKPEVTTTYRWYLPDLGYAGDTYSAGSPSSSCRRPASRRRADPARAPVTPRPGRRRPAATQEPDRPTSAPPQPDSGRPSRRRCRPQEPEPPSPPTEPPSEEPTADPTPDPTPPAESTEPALATRH